MKKLLVFCAFFFAVIAGAGPVAAAPVDDVLLELTYKPNQLCSYPVQLVVTGKSKLIELPGDRIFIASPGQEVTITNLRTGESETFLITGSTHAQVEDDGTTEVTVTGLNIVLNPRESQSDEPGIFLLEGNFNFALKADGTEERVFSGTGEVTDICALLE
ncbi:hypothetical protein ACJJV6_03055 [Arthrobacter nitrophenolicus]|uniref:Uncharacterized protein n=2 Tax=Arthrobacter nitrophenolicus TaxID=683150 RepID=A0ACC6TDE1_9MICC|nr:hypothetical protein [Arthrobacter nitrophenolicus]ELT45922.1 hypothetical protein G205_01678 [Arthrobacter nitrophenolicus]